MGDQRTRGTVFKPKPTDEIAESMPKSRLAGIFTSTLQDIRFALRTLAKSWAFTFTAILILALGIGANTAIFQLLDAVRLRNLPVAHPEQLATVEIKGGNRSFGIHFNEELLTYPQFDEIRRHQEAFSDVFAWGSLGTLSLGEGSHRKRGRDLWVSSEAFSTLGVPAFRGRLFATEDVQSNCGAPGAVISYGFWQSEFGGEDSAIGRKLVIQDIPTEVIGVTPPSFFGLEVGRRFDFALPLCALAAYVSPSLNFPARRDFFWLGVMGRLKAGVSVEQGSSQLSSISPGIMEATLSTGYSASALDEYRKFQLAAYPAGNGVSSLRRIYDAPLRLLLGTTALVLLIACANLANLTLARSSTREREMAVRLAVGASRWRLIRELLSESVILAGSGGVVGIALAEVFSRNLVKFLSTESDVIQLDLSLDWRLLTFTAAVCMLTCVIFGLVPALRCSRTEPGVALKGGSRGTTAGRERFTFQRWLIVSQIAVSLVLLVGALLFVRSFWNLMTIDPGFREKDILIARIGLQGVRLSRETSPSFVQSLLDHVKTVPYVESAATSTHLPLYPGVFWNLGVRVDNAEGSAKFTWVSPGYFQTMGIPLRAGRDFSDRDTTTSPHVAVVNEAFARTFFGGEALGRVFRTNEEVDYPEATYQIVGLIRDTKYEQLREPTPPMAFVPASQFPAAANHYFLFIFIRSTAPGSTLIPAVREKLSEVNPDISLEFKAFQTQIENGLTRERMMALLSAFFGGLAALLAMIGLYGVISYIVTMRKNEIGIRMALGASRGTIISGILKQTIYVLVIGVTLGLALALAASQGAASLLFGLQPNDPLTLICAAGFLIIIALVASYVPALRASRVDPSIALRYE
jgi:predicted permease